MKNNLKEIREKSGLSLQNLGDMCRRSKAQIWELEKDGSNPTLLTAYRICSVLNKDIYEIWPNTIEVIEETITIRRVKA